MEEVDEDAYTLAIVYLTQGTLPIVVTVDGHLHVMQIVPTSRETVQAMVDEDEAKRLKFLVHAVVAVKQRLEAEART